MGVMLAVTSVGMVPAVFLREVWIRYRASKGLWYAVLDTFRATTGWSPKHPELNKEYCNLLEEEVKKADWRPSTH